MVEEIEIICERENALGGPLVYVDRSLTDYVSYSTTVALINIELINFCSVRYFTLSYRIYVET